MEYIIIIFGFLILLIVKGIYDKRNQKLKLIQKIENEWGKKPNRQYNLEELNTISSYYKYAENVSYDVDDITWNDLDMDEIFAIINHTSSSIGEEYLYATLRKLNFDKEELEERNRLIEFFSKNSDMRKKLQIPLHRLGKLRNISVYEYFNLLDSLNRKSNLPHYITSIALILCIISVLYQPAYGFFLSFIMVGINVFQYYKEKARINAYISVCSYIIRLLHSVKEITDIECMELESYGNQLKKARKKFTKFKKGAWIVAGENQNGSLADLVMDYVKMLFHIDLIKFNSMLDSFKKNKDSLNEIYYIIGYLDSMIAIASFRESLDYYSVPKLTAQDKPYIHAEEVFHPLVEEPIPNSIKEDRCVLLTGSNASGKSTFLKTLAINAILAQTIYTVTCKKYSGSYFYIATSMALQDNIKLQESYYIVEIKSLKRIIDCVNEKIPVLCFVDEVLRGTNTLERIAASSRILHQFSQYNALCFAATHDNELTHILENDYSNYHFQEYIQDNQIFFDYKLQSGRAVSRNAIKLLEIMGYSKEIIDNAEKSVNDFLETGMWTNL